MGCLVVSALSPYPKQTPALFYAKRVLSPDNEVQNLNERNSKDLSKNDNVSTTENISQNGTNPDKSTDVHEIFRTFARTNFNQSLCA